MHLHQILDFFFPRICPICGGRLSLTEDAVCIDCLMKLPRTMHHTCPERNTMKDLFELQIPVIRAAALMRYIPESESSRLIKTIKYRKGAAIAQAMGRMMAEEYMNSGGRGKLYDVKSRFFDGIDLIIPMPLTRQRQKKRGYNQTEEIAKGVSQVTGIPVDTPVVARTSFKTSQTSLSHYERYENVKDAFRCIHPERLNGKHILLIDDVVTTGSTMLSLARSIQSAATGVTFSILSLGITGETKHFL